MPDVYPEHVPRPRCVLCWDGLAYRAVACDGGGRVQVRGEDQLFSFKSVLAISTVGVPSGANGYIATPAVGAGEIWVVTTIAGYDLTGALTSIRFITIHDAVIVHLREERRAIAASEVISWSGHTYLDAGDSVRAYFTGCLVGDTVVVDVSGYRMTVET